MIRAAFHRLGRINPTAALPLLLASAWVSGSTSAMTLAALVFPTLLLWRSTSDPAGPVAAGDAPVDALTGLGTRRAALVWLESALRQRRADARGFAVIALDLAGFRDFGRQAGSECADLVLRLTAERIRACLRSEDLAVRGHADCFLVLLAPAQNLDGDALERLAERLMARVTEPFDVDGHLGSLGCSIGLCRSGNAHANTPDALIEGAEVALEQSKAMGSGQITHFSRRMRDDLIRRGALSGEIAEALENGQIRAWFQPQVCSDTGRVTGFEALARWHHPEDGVLSPGAFLDQVLDGGHAERLSEVMLMQGLQALRAWDDADLKIDTVGVNFSTTELRNPRLIDRIQWEVDRQNLTADRLSIEILETVLCDHDDDVLARNIRRLSSSGYCIDLDDFGTGHAAIANIRRFAVKRIKIDRSFVHGIDHNEDLRKLVSAMVRMAESLGIETLAEGVETIAEQGVLAQLGVGIIQGFGPARPMPFEDTIAWLRSHAKSLPTNAPPSRRIG